MWSSVTGTGLRTGRLLWRSEQNDRVGTRIELGTSGQRAGGDGEKLRLGAAVNSGVAHSESTQPVDRLEIEGVARASLDEIRGHCSKGTETEKRGVVLVGVCQAIHCFVDAQDRSDHEQKLQSEALNAPFDCLVQVPVVNRQ